MTKRKAATTLTPAPAASAASVPPRLLSLGQFLQLFRDSREPGNDMRFCFILGSGASVQSGVPTGTGLVEDWLRTLHRQHAPDANDSETEAWAASAFRHLPSFTWARRAEFYGNLYEKRFPDNAAGQAWLRQLMEGKRPSFGYSVLAGILARSRHNLVITTNFDNLVHDALVAIGKPRAYIAHSPEDARFLANHEDKPRILKLHGDIDRETYNHSNLISALPPKWRQPLRNLLGAYTPVFIGYGGCDPGLMGFLNTVYAPSAARMRPIWAYCVDRKALATAPDPVSDPPGRPDTDFATTFAKKHRAWWLPTPGFDELMVLLAHAMGIPHAGKEITASAERLRDAYHENLKAALHAARSTDAARWCPQLNAFTLEAETHLVSPAATRSWKEWRDYIESAAFPDERIARAKEAVKIQPADPCLFAALAWELYSKDPSSPEVDSVLYQADALCTERFPPESEAVLEVRTTRAGIALKEGDAATAEREYREIVRLLILVVGPESRTTLRVRNDLAAALLSLGKYAEAEADYRVLLAEQERVLGAEHTDTLRSRNNLGFCLGKQERWGEALTEVRQALAGWRKVLGSEHSDTKIAERLAEEIQQKMQDAEKVGRQQPGKAGP